MNEILTILIGTIFVGNVVLTQYLGLCPFYGVSKKWGNSVGLAITSMLVLFVSIVLSYMVYTWILIPLDVTYLRLVVMMLMMVVLVHVIEKLVKRFLPTLSVLTQPYFPLLAMNSLALGTSLVVIDANFSMLEVIGYALGAPLGFALVLILFASMHERVLQHDKVPHAFKGSAIAFIMTALMAMAFMAFSGIV
jgi:Na+-translocating ferredoxin:NAD+ oxidoreductase subunit A